MSAGEEAESMLHSMGAGNTFKYVLIPADPSVPPEEREGDGTKPVTGVTHRSHTVL